jgi:predicted transcriptional regulator
MAEDSTPGQGPGKDLMEQVTQVITAYLSHNTVPPAEVRGVVRDIFEQYAEMANPKPAQEVETTRPVPAVPVRRSITPDYLICLEDGSKRAALTRYLRSRYDMTPDEYRRKWGLPADYPMTAPNVQARNSARAKQHGFGRHRGVDGQGQQPAPAEAEEPAAPAPPEPSAPAAPKRRGRTAQTSESEATAPTSRPGAVPAAPPTRRGRGRGASPASAE